MRFRIGDPAKVARIATAITLLVILVWGLVSVFFEVRPFWVDEWRIVYNLKFKTVHEIWGRLAFMQQFPRVYLSLLKVFTEQFDYNYFSLRIPSFIIGATTMLCLYRLANRLYPVANYNRFLLVMVLISCSTFTEYYVQTKQYTMDLFLCVAAVWQLFYLLRIGEGRALGPFTYTLLCGGFLAAPFFSYTYPLTIAPVYFVVLVQNIILWRSEKGTQDKIKTIARQWFPLFICTFSITVFYVCDVSQLTADQDMHGYWAHLMMKNGFEWQVFLANAFDFFAEIGAGLIFWWLFGLIGSVSFIYGTYVCCRRFFSGKLSTDDLLPLYSVLLIMLVFMLSAAGKLPLGEPRLNAFAIPAISVLIILLLDDLKTKPRVAMVSKVLSFILLAGVIGNIYSTVAASFLDSKYARRMQVYRSTQRAVKEATEKKLSILVTPAVAYPYENTPNLPLGNNVPGDWVLMTFPAYSNKESMPVYAIDDTGKLADYLKRLPPGIKSVMVGDGINYRIVKVND